MAGNTGVVRAAGLQVFAVGQGQISEQIEDLGLAVQIIPAVRVGLFQLLNLRVRQIVVERGRVRGGGAGAVSEISDGGMRAG
ncbi:MAG: hypothetical protein AAF732_06795 [Pseudomonadota bacterium]